MYGKPQLMYGKPLECFEGVPGMTRSERDEKIEPRTDRAPSTLRPPRLLIVPVA
jgi:hypothetical protein